MIKICKKWYFWIFTNLIDVTVVNVHVLFCLVNDFIPLSDFRKYIIRISMRKIFISDSKKVGRPILNKSANLCILSQVEKMELIIIYKKLTVVSTKNMPSAK